MSEECGYNRKTGKCSRKAFPHQKEKCELNSNNRCVTKKTAKVVRGVAKKKL